MGKPKRERVLDESAAKAVTKNLRISPQKLNLVAQMIRGKKVDTALAELEFSRKRIAKDVRKCVMSAVANAENNHNLDVNDLVVKEAYVGKNMVITPLPCPRPRPHEPDREAVCAAHRGGEGAGGRDSSRRRRVMGHKVNPIGLRVGINRTWDSRWFASRAEYGRLLHEDMHIRDHILEQQRQAGISKVVIERPHKKCRVTVHTARPGVLIGKKGADIEKLRGELAKLTSSEVHLNIVEVRKPEIDAKLVAETIAQQLERRVAFRRAMKRAVQSAIRLGALGIRINCSGRLGGAEIARVEWYREGRVPLHTLRADIDFGYGLAKTAYGVIGVKVWIFKGEIMEHDPMASEKRAVEAQEGGGGGRRRSGGGDRDGGWTGGERQAEPAKA